MTDATIIQLQPSQSVTNVVRFEDAFGEYSEAGGGAERRRRRQERRMARIRARQERRRARREGRLEAARERNEIRGERRRGRLERRHMKDKYDNDESGSGETSDSSNGGGDNGGGENSLPPRTAPSQDGGSQDGGSQDGGSQGGGSQGGGNYQEDNYNQGGGSQGGGRYQGGSQGGNDYANDGASVGSDEPNEDSSNEESVDEQNSDDAGSGDSGFDGVMGAEDRFAEFTDSNVAVNPTVQDIANKIEWNKELISRLRIKAAKERGQNLSTENTLMDIEKRKLRIAELENQIQGYANAEGEFSSANGCYCSYDGMSDDMDSDFDGDGLDGTDLMNSFDGAGLDGEDIMNYFDGIGLDGEDLMNSFDGESLDGEGLMSNAGGVSEAVKMRRMRRMNMIKRRMPKNRLEQKNIAMKRRQEVGRAYSIAKKERSKHTISKRTNVTPVSSSLRPAISPNRIEVSLNASGTGNIGLDNVNDFDAPSSRIFEMTSGADGSSSINVTGVLIGVGIAAAAIWALNKYKIV